MERSSPDDDSDPAWFAEDRFGSRTCTFLGARIIGMDRANADDRVFKHGNSHYGDLKYPPDFKHFDYVNPNAPKGGRLRLAAVGSFDSLNPYIIKGEVAAGIMGFVLETLTSREFR